jgi:sortase A
MKKALLIILIAIIGASLLLYPRVASYLAQQNGTFAVEAYAERIAGSSEEELSAAWSRAVEYNDNLSGSPTHDPFVEDSGMAMQDDYFQILDIDGVMGSVNIPQINLKLPIYHGTSEEVLKKGVGHLEGSSLPVGGQSTHSVLTGHTGLANAKLFTDLTELGQGDVFYVQVLGQTLAYQIDQISIVEPNDTQLLKRIRQGDFCTLVTCTPYGINSHRLLVRGVRIDYAPGDELVAEQSRAGMSAEDRLTIMVIAATALFMLLLGIVIKVVVRLRGRARVAQDDDILQPAPPVVIYPARPVLVSAAPAEVPDAMPDAASDAASDAAHAELPAAAPTIEEHNDQSDTEGASRWIKRRT